MVVTAKLVDVRLEDVMTEEGANKAYETIMKMAQKYAAQLNELDEQESA